MVFEGSLDLFDESFSCIDLKEHCYPRGDIGEEQINGSVGLTRNFTYYIYP